MVFWQVYCDVVVVYSDLIVDWVQFVFGMIVWDFYGGVGVFVVVLGEVVGEFGWVLIVDILCLVFGVVCVVLVDLFQVEVVIGLVWWVLVV